MIVQKIMRNASRQVCPIFTLTISLGNKMQLPFIEHYKPKSTFEKKKRLHHLIIRHNKQSLTLCLYFLHQAIKLCSILPSLTEHHHNKACLASLSPYGRRGQYLQRRVSYLMLRQLFDMEPSPEDKIENCKVRRSFMNLAPVSRYVWQDELDSAVSLLCTV